MMRFKKFPIALLLFSLFSHSLLAQKKITISGTVKEKGSHELLPGVSVYVPEIKAGVSCNNYGFYSITMNETDSVTLLFSIVGYQSQKIKIGGKQSTKIDLEMSGEVQLAEVVIETEKANENSQKTDMSKIDIPVEQIKSIPALLGEKDVLKVLQLLPGVQKGNEGSSGFYVRGGGPDQNLIILDDAPVYNASHLFGFFSVFNGDALKKVELTKGGFPARYGGRLSSVLDLQMKDGDKKEYHGEAGIGIISSRFTLEGPIQKEKSSFLISARRTYIDALIYPFLKEDKGGYFFYDLNAKVNFVLNDKNRLYLSGYFGRDKFYFSSKDDDFEFKGGLTWGNATGTLRWNHIFNDKLFSNLSLITTDYKMKIYAEENFAGDKFSATFYSGIRDYSLKYDVDFYPNPRHNIKAGVHYIYHIFTPSATVIKGNADDELGNGKVTILGQEGGLYMEDDITITPTFKVLGGIRMSTFTNSNKTYINPEPRISARYLIRDDLSIKASYAIMNQYLHLLSNTGINIPTDLWVPATKNILPQQSQQYAAGIFKDLEKHKLSLSIEGYYKTTKGNIAYKDGTSFMDIMPENISSEEAQARWERKVTSGTALSYGAEFLLQKKKGKWSGWIGYTLSWTTLQFDSLNFGKRFYARYDRRHDISIVNIYKITDEIQFSAIWTFATGNALTLPTGTYQPEFHNSQEEFHTMGEGNNFFYSVQDYGEKNSFRMAPYHRLDIGIQFSKKFPKYTRTWEISCYNSYNRMNPFFYYLSYENNKSVLKQITLFPIIPSVSWNIKF